MKSLNILDQIINNFDQALRTIIIPEKRITNRNLFNYSNNQEDSLTLKEKRHIAGLMRVNHAGEVCAQALYQGQNLTARSLQIKQQLQQAALEENDHLAWCEQRLKELNSNCSVFNPFWYCGSLAIGIFVGIFGDNFSMGFIAETENQVSRHLNHHLKILPPKDQQTYAIIKQMQLDEKQHAKMAQTTSTTKLPVFICQIMAITAKFMTTLSYYA